MPGFNFGLDGHRIKPLTEREAQDIAEGLGIVYRAARENMLSAVAKRIRKGMNSPGWTEQKASEVTQAHAQFESQLRKAQKTRSGILGNTLTRAAVTGNRQFYRDMQSVVGNVAQISPNAQKVAYILADLNNSLGAAERRILRQFDDKYSHIIGSVSAEMATGTTTVQQAVSKAMKAFSDEGIDGFIDRSGRHWKMESYAEMATLAAIERATVAGYVDTMQSYGYDLAVIDGHAGSCPICTAWEGVIVSVSGDHPDYPSLSDAEAAGVFHPRCVHDIHTYYEGVTHEPEGGFRDHPRAIEPPNEEYTARSQQRYMERQIRKYKDRMRVAITPQDERQAYNMVKRWQGNLRQHIKKNSDKVLLRQYMREGGKVKLKFPLDEIRRKWDDDFNAKFTAKTSSELLKNFDKPRGITEKLTTYVLNEQHHIGRHKAIVFQSALGYNEGNAEELRREIRKGLGVYKAIHVASTEYGEKYNVEMLVNGANGNRQPIISGWIYEVGEETPRMVTAYVDGKLKRP